MPAAILATTVGLVFIFIWCDTLFQIPYHIMEPESVLEEGWQWGAALRSRGRYDCHHKFRTIKCLWKVSRLRDCDLCYSCTMVARGLRGVRKWRRYIDHEGGARVGLCTRSHESRHVKHKQNAIVQVSCMIRSHATSRETCSTPESEAKFTPIFYLPCSIRHRP